MIQGLSMSVKRIVIAVCMGFLIGIPAWCMPVEAQAQSAASSKIDPILNTMKFVRWPEQSKPSHNFVFCILGNNPFGRELDALTERSVDGRPIRPIADISPSFAQYCHAVFIGDSEEKRLAAVLQELRGFPVLTVSDIAGFSAAGGMIEVQVDEQGKVSLAANQQSAESQGLRISSKLLTLSR